MRGVQKALAEEEADGRLVSAPSKDAVVQQKGNGMFVNVQKVGEMEISSIEASERSGVPSKDGNTGSGKGKKKKSRKTNETDVQFSIHVNEKLIRYCKFYKESRDSNPKGSMGAFVRKHYYSDLSYVKCDDNDGFAVWWARKQKSLKERIKVKRTNIMSSVYKVFKGKQTVLQGDVNCWVRILTSSSFVFSKSLYEKAISKLS